MGFLNRLTRLVEAEALTAKKAIKEALRTTKVGDTVARSVDSMLSKGERFLNAHNPEGMTPPSQSRTAPSVPLTQQEKAEIAEELALALRLQRRRELLVEHVRTTTAKISTPADDTGAVTQEVRANQNTTPPAGEPVRHMPGKVKRFMGPRSPAETHASSPELTPPVRRMGPRRQD